MDNYNTPNQISYPINVHYKCPYCGFDQLHRGLRMNSTIGQEFVVTCDFEEGGCGRMLALSVTLKVVTTVYKLVEVIND